jgi:hypothetical protein
MTTTSLHYRSRWREGLIRRTGVAGDGGADSQLEVALETTWAGDPQSLFSLPGFCSPSR